MGTLDTEISLVTTYKISEVEKPAIDFSTDYGQWAVAVNGSTILKSDGKETV